MGSTLLLKLCLQRPLAGAEVLGLACGCGGCGRAGQFVRFLPRPGRRQRRSFEAMGSAVFDFSGVQRWTTEKSNSEGRSKRWDQHLPAPNS
eukprot:SAG31_NODE_29698_length_391_cov_0.825342_1_plen_90_part_01